MLSRDSASNSERTVLGSIVDQGNAPLDRRYGPVSLSIDSTDSSRIGCSLMHVDSGHSSRNDSTPMSVDSGHSSRNDSTPMSVDSGHSSRNDSTPMSVDSVDSSRNESSPMSIETSLSSHSSTNAFAPSIDPRHSAIDIRYLCRLVTPSGHRFISPEIPKQTRGTPYARQKKQSFGGDPNMAYRVSTQPFDFKIDSDLKQLPLTARNDALSRATLGIPQKQFKKQRILTRLEIKTQTSQSSSTTALMEQLNLSYPFKETRKGDSFEPRYFRGLDAPGLRDDYYCSQLVKLSDQNMLSASLENKVWIQNKVCDDVQNRQTIKLCEYPVRISSLLWHAGGKHISLGLFNGNIETWDLVAQKCIYKLDQVHTNRIDALAWDGQCILSGGIDGSIIKTDLRKSPSLIAKLTKHTNRISGLSVSSDGHYFASGGNDNKVYIWHTNIGNRTLPIYEYRLKAACKVACNPFDRAELAIGGGTSDQSVKVVNMVNNNQKCLMDMKAQVCNLAWYNDGDSLAVSTGFSTNSVNLFGIKRNKDRTKIKFEPKNTLKHDARPLQSDVSSCGTKLVSAAGEKVFFFKVCPDRKTGSSLENLSSKFTWKNQIR